MIHGQPNVPRKRAEFYAKSDWTDGCIALSNSDMVDVWLRTGVGHPDRDPALSEVRREDASRRGRMPATPEDTDAVDARVAPSGSLENLSQHEVDRLLDSSRGGLYPLYRRCSLAVLNSGGETDDARAIFDRYADFEISIVRQAWGVKLELHNAPAAAFVDGRMIRGIQEHLFAVLRDILYVHGEVLRARQCRTARVAGHHQRGISRVAQCGRAACRGCGRTSWSAGAGTRSAATSTNTPSRSVTSSACAASTSAPAAARER